MKVLINSPVQILKVYLSFAVTLALCSIFDVSSAAVGYSISSTVSKTSAINVSCPHSKQPNHWWQTDILNFLLTHVIIAWLKIFIYLGNNWYSDHVTIALKNIYFPNAEREYMENESRDEWHTKMESERPKGQAQMKTARDSIVKKGFCTELGIKCKTFERFCALLKKDLFGSFFFF